MTHIRHLSLTVVFALALTPDIALAQQNNSTAEAETVMRGKAVTLLESLAGQLSSLQSGENRARLASNIAESLWTHDEDRARALFRSVGDDLKVVLQSSEGDEIGDWQTFMVFLKLRQDTIDRIVKHDPEFALAFLKDTKPVTKLRNLADNEISVELRLAKRIAAANPDLAFNLGRQSLARGFSNDQLVLLRLLQRKSADQASLLYKEMVLKLQGASLTSDWNARHFAQDLAQFFIPRAPDESTFRDLINIFISTAQSNGCSVKKPGENTADICFLVGRLLPQIAEVSPTQAAQLKQWKTENGWSRWQLGSIEINEAVQNGTIDDVLSLASQYPQNAEEASWQAMLMAKASGDLERARKIANGYDGEPEKKRMMLAQLERAQEGTSMTEEQLAKAQRKAAQTFPIEARSTLLLGIAIMAAGSRNAALTLLDQASEVAGSIKPGKTQAEHQIRIATMYCFEKSDRGFAMMEALVPKLNELVSAAAKLDNYDNRYLRDGEWNMTSEGGLGSLLNLLAQNAGYFAWYDFDRALSLASQFERPEIRMMAQLKLAQGILAGRPKPDQRVAMY